jgi:hypothetical protein
MQADADLTTDSSKTDKYADFVSDMAINKAFDPIPSKYEICD